MSKKNFQQGKFSPQNPSKYVGDLKKIVFRSSWERKFMNWCDLNDSVLSWTSEGLVIDYYSPIDQRNRRYFVDFVVRMVNSDGIEEDVIVEIKPEKETIPPKRGNKKESTYLKECYTWSVNSSKWAAAQKFAKERNMKFLILNEHHLGVARSKK